MKKFTHGFLAFLFSLVTLVAYSQTSNSNVNLKDVTVISGTGLNLDICGTPDTITLYVNNSGTSALTNVSINAVLASGMHYIAGSAYVTTTMGGTTSTDPLTENASNIQNPIFTLTNGLASGATRYVRFLVEGDCNIFTAIGNPMYNAYSLNFKIGATSYQNNDETPQPYNNAFQITNIPQPTWVSGQTLNLLNGQTGCRKYFIQNTTATHGSVNNIMLYDMFTPGMTVVSLGISSTSGGAVTPLTVTVTGDTAFATINSATLIAAGFGDSLTIPTVIVGTVNGTIIGVGDNGTVIYMPDSDLHSVNGQPVDSFRYYICDTLAAHQPRPLCDTAEVYIYVTPMNLPPVANNIYLFTPENTPIGVNVASGAYDPNGDPLTYSYPNGTTTTQGGHIVITNNGAVNYYPPAGFIGVDSFEYQVCDSSPYNIHSLCDSAWVIITVTPPGDTLVNHPPVASNDYGITVPGATITINVKANDSDPDGNPINVKTVSNSELGVVPVINANGTVSYTAPDSISGSIVVDTFTYILCDTNALHAIHVLCDTATVYITINKVDTNIVNTNRPPVAADDFGIICENDNSTINVLTNDIDPDGDPIAITAIVAGPYHGAAALSGADVIYVPDFDYYGQDSLEYRICDNRTPSLCSTAWVHYTIRAVSVPVRAVEDTAVTGMNTAVTIDVTANDIVPDTNHVSITAFTPPAHGTLIFVGRNITYVPNPGFAGYDTFYYRVCNLQIPGMVYCDSFITQCDVGLVSVDVIHLGPHIDSIYVTIPENTPLDTICPLITDPQGNSVTITTFACGPSHGTASTSNSGSDSCLTYSPNHDFVGHDTICVVVCDNILPNHLCDTNKVYITVTPVCQAPVANNDSYSVTNVQTNLGLQVLANDTNYDTSALVMNLVTQPVCGTAVVFANTQINYTPNPNISCNDSFKYSICNVGPTCRLCDTATVYVSVKPTPVRPPKAVNDTVTILENTDTCIHVTANDLPGTNPFTITSKCNPQHGTNSISANGYICYNPAPGFVGLDSFCYTICDNSVPALCSSAIVYVNVVPNNHAPIAVNDTACTYQGTPVVICVLGNDHAGSNSIAPNTLSLVTQSANGTVTGINAQGCITFVPNNVAGIDSFKYRICDSTLAINGGPLCSTATVYVNVNELNHKPVVANTTATVTEDSSVVVCPTISDPDSGQTATIKSVCTPSHGTAVITSGTCVDYTPDPLYFGSDSFCVVVCDNSTLPSCAGASTVLCDTSIIHINVTHVPHCPIANIDYANGHDTVPVNINELVNDYYVHAIGAGSSVTIVSGPAAGNTATVNPNGTITYTAGIGYQGIDTIVYKLTDSIEGCDSLADIIIFTNDTTCFGPKLFTLHDSVCENGVISIDVLSSEFVGNTGLGSFTIVNGGNHGFTVLNTLTDSILYQPDPGFFGYDTLRYQICDRCTPTPNCDTASLIMHVLYTNHTPTAIDDTVTLYENHSDTINVLLNDHTVDSVPLTISISAQPDHGTLTVWNNQLIYTPTQYYCGVDSFGYRVTEPSGSPLCTNERPWDLGLVFVNVICVNQPPYIPDTLIHIPEDTTPISLCLPFIEHQQGETDTITAVCQPSHGTLTSLTISNVTNQVCLTYAVDSNFVGVDSICVVICNDGTPSLCDTSHITIVVYPIIIAVNDTSLTGCHTPVVICVKNNDYSMGGMPFVVAGITTQPAHGTATIDSTTQCVVYTPDGTAANFPGGIIDSFMYYDRDSVGATSSAWVYVRVICCSIHAASDTFTINYGDTLYAPVLVNDTYNDTFPHTLGIDTGSGPQNGHVTVINDSTIKYVPNRGFCGKDTFKYVLSDICGSDTGLVVINVLCDSNCHAPIAINDSVIHGYQCNDTINVLANDTFVAGATVSVVTGPMYGTDTVINNEIVYIPDGNHPADLDSLTYSLCNPCGRCDTAVLKIQLSDYPCNVYHPHVGNVRDTICKNTSTVIPVLNSCSDPNGYSLYVNLVTTPTNGTTFVQGDSVIFYHPRPGFVGIDSFTYQACNTGVPNLCNTGFVYVDVLPCTPPPIHVPDSIIHDTTIVCTPTIVCIDSIYQGLGDSVSFVGFCQDPSHGTFVINGSDTASANNGTLCFTYTPACDTTGGVAPYVGNDTICLIICSTGVDTVCTNTEVIITILPAPPVDSLEANPDISYTCNAPDTIPVLANDVFAPHPGNAQLGTGIYVYAAGAQAGEAPLHGTVTVGLDSTVVIYIPDANYVGVDSFQYVAAKNGTLQLYDTTTVVVYVCTTPQPVAVNDNPSCLDTTGYVNQPAVINILGNDRLQLATDTAIVVVDSTIHGRLIVNPNLTVTYIPDSGFRGNDNFSYQVVEFAGNKIGYSDTATVCIDIVDTTAICFFPNGFSPNGDGINDEFVFPCNDKYPNASLEVFNRWGDPIWQSSGGYKNDWAGTNQQGTPVPDGTYYFVYKYNDGSGRSVARFVVVYRGPHK